MVFGPFLDCAKLKNLGEMGKEVEDVEEGEISDTASVEEISEEDFNKQDVVKVNNNNNNNNNKPKGGGGDARVWAVHDLYSKYPTICRGYASGLYNLAWAQAVQNKPLNDIFVMDVDSDASANSNNSNRSSSCSVNAVKEMVVVDVDDKEEGELEEGEIDADAEPQAEAGSVVVGGGGGGVSETVSNSEQLGVREVLEGVTVANVEESFAETCYKLQNALQSLPEVLSGLAVSEKDDLVRLSSNAIEIVNSVFCSLDHLQKEQNKEKILRLLSSVKDKIAHLFSTEHMKEIQVMITAIDSIGAIGNSESIGEENELQSHEIKTQEIPSVKAIELISSSQLLHSDSIGASEALISGQSNIKGRGVLLPLLDLHKDHDADSLPSPTREAPSCFPVNKSSSVGEGMVRSGLPAGKMEAGKMELDSEDSKFHLYETDALKAVSSYQLKFGRSSFLTNDKLPSPTPSGDCENGVVDANEEVSSASIPSSLTSTMPPPFLDLPPVSSASVDRSSVHGLINSRIDAPGSGSYPMKSLAKSRDPRLRINNSDANALDLNQPSVIHNMPKVEYAGTVVSRKQKAVEEPSLDFTISKRLKNSFENPERNMREVRTAAGNGGWLEETAVSGSQLIERNHLMENVEAEPKKTLSIVSSSRTDSGNFNVTSNGNEQAPVTSSSTTASLPALLRDIAVNPTVLLNILIEQQQRLAAEAKMKSADSATSTPHRSSSNSAMGTDPNVSIGPSMTTGLLQSSVGMLPVSSQATSTVQSLQDDSGKIRMKPRDPRRILHTNSTLQKNGSLGSEQFKSIGSPASNNQGTGDNVNAQKLEVRADTKLVPTQSIAPPDIARQFTRNLKNIADIISVSQESSNHNPAAQIFSSASVPLTLDRAEQKSAVSNSQNLQAGIGSAPETCASDSSRSQNTWEDVEHLFEGYDEQQKAAIQRERARRMEEQNKMFAARKLCLVLDLDHTLLNSAKFVEVDPVHDEILRKKEEQDREKPHRHLFRFPHMGMWTKLRPGIWNFLEKASKLYELHLYTMGNKLYATEMAKVLDPNGALFSGRVISRGDDTDSGDGDERAPKSKDLEGVLGMESAVVIIDDSVRVWPHNKLNLIVVERYTYFPCSRRQFGLPGPSLLEIDHDERPEAGTLASSLAVIERLHQNFFASQSLEEVDVRNILASEQRKILGGCRIVFSRVFPVGEVNPHLHPLWQTAEQFGAVCTNQIDEQVTHVVANSLGTDKVNWALSTGRFVVHPGWVEASALLYRRANEQDFAIKP
ncbi:RNA polymerase II C-terminal domain phosphatase-like 3 [Gastrolobium bilobum]|uniref:RNA polymerase II C-terminal domain phosphatase-like 3 n=1 Tax=Gastrolobium bilobum TaxID=150636 RepID=UPI002AAFFA2F|nr:RNA polymerase II C-terminal domain phosphatase-like 3 [Gastrolobium bilobum]